MNNLKFEIICLNWIISPNRGRCSTYFYGKNFLKEKFFENEKIQDFECVCVVFYFWGGHDLIILPVFPPCTKVIQICMSANCLT